MPDFPVTFPVFGGRQSESTRAGDAVPLHESGKDGLRSYNLAGYHDLTITPEHKIHLESHGFQPLTGDFVKNKTYLFDAHPKLIDAETLEKLKTETPNQEAANGARGAYQHADVNGDPSIEIADHREIGWTPRASLKLSDYNNTHPMQAYLRQGLDNYYREGMGEPPAYQPYE